AAGRAPGGAEYGRGRSDAGREAWPRSATTTRPDPRAPAALLLSADLSARAGDFPAAQKALDDLVARYPESEYTEIARLNRAILAIRAGRGPSVLGDLNELIRNAPLSPYVGRMRLARGVVLAGEGKTS